MDKPTRTYVQAEMRDLAEAVRKLGVEIDKRRIELKLAPPGDVVCMKTFDEVITPNETVCQSRVIVWSDGWGVYYLAHYHGPTDVAVGLWYFTDKSAACAAALSYEGFKTWHNAESDYRDQPELPGGQRLEPYRCPYRP